MSPKFQQIRLPGSRGRQRRFVFFGALWILTFSLLLSTITLSEAGAAGSSYGGGGGGTGGGISGLPVLGVRSVGAAAATITFDVPLATIIVNVPANTFVNNSQIAVLNAASIAQSPSGYGPVEFAYDIVGKTPTGTFMTIFANALTITITGLQITGSQSFFKLFGTNWIALATTLNVSGSMSYSETSGLVIEATTRIPTTTTTRPVATTTTTRPVATTTTTIPPTTTTTRPVATTTTTTTTIPPTTTTTRPVATTTTTRPVATTSTTVRGHIAVRYSRRN
jgi:hypothetical protein